MRHLEFENYWAHWKSRIQLQVVTYGRVALGAGMDMVDFGLWVAHHSRHYTVRIFLGLARTTSCQSASRDRGVQIIHAEI